MPALFACTLFVSALLLFLLQPMIAKMILPTFGGSPAVWNTCMLFFQSMLLLGYAYAHAASTRWNRRRQVFAHIGLLLAGLLALPGFLFLKSIATKLAPPVESNPTPWVLAVLFVSIGVPFFVVSTMAPLMQKWFAATADERARDPYFLYVASNTGSMLALLSYPFALEPLLELHVQAWLWCAGYALLIVLTLFCARQLLWAAPASLAPPKLQTELPKSPRRPVAPSPRLQTLPTITPQRRLRWLALAFIPSSLMLGVTSYFAADLASIPLVWVIPLALYLLSFIVVFTRLPAWALPTFALLLPIALLLQAFLIQVDVPNPIWVFLLLHLCSFFIVALFCHGELAHDRPPPESLTEFYLWMSLGGFLGGFFNAIVAPQMFHLVLEYPLVMVFACFLESSEEAGDSKTAIGWRRLGLPLALGLVTAFLVVAMQATYTQAGWLNSLMLYGLPALLCMVLCYRFACYPLRFGLGAAIVLAGVEIDQSFHTHQGLVLHQERNFFGVLRVLADEADRSIKLMHGTTLHGRQPMDADGRPIRGSVPQYYYYPTGPIGQIFAVFKSEDRKPPIAVIGLGVGAIAYYGQPGQEFTYYEIDPAVERLAKEQRFFTYLAEAESRGVKMNIVLGDARRTLSDAPNGHYGLIVVDAFSSDAIPVHLITVEAIKLYTTKLTGHGLLALHVSNRYLDLLPVMTALARDAGLACRCQIDWEVSKEEKAKGKEPSVWVMMARSDRDFGRLVTDDPRPEALKRWYVPEATTNKAWTDEYSNILQAMQWGKSE